MIQGNFYFIHDDYYKEFSGFGLLENKEIVDGKLHGRPCYYAFKEHDTQIYWMIPISSKINKYQKIYEKAINRYGTCDYISFGYILGDKKAFLIQNMCPVIDEYVTSVYIDQNTSNPITIPPKLQSELNAKIRKAIRLYRKGTKIVLSNALDIETALLAKINEADKQIASTNEDSETSD